MAMAAYSKQANDETLEKLAHQIRNRAVLQLGRLLKEIEPSKGGRPKTPESDPRVSSRRIL